jgi:hypothetical protein
MFRRAFIVTLLLALAACGKKREVVEDLAQTLRNQVADSVSEAPEARKGEIETGATTWQSSFAEAAITTADGFTTRPFRLQIRNRSGSPQKFRATIRYLDRDGNEIRTRAVPESVVAPFSDRIIDDKLVAPLKVAAKIHEAKADVELVPWDAEPGP